MLARGGAGAAADDDAGLEFVELVLDLLAGVLGGAAHQHLARERGGRGAALQGVLVAEADDDGGVDLLAAGLLVDEGQLQAALQVAADGALVDVAGAGVELFALRHGGIALVVLHELVDVGGVGISARTGLFSGMNSPTVRLEGMRYFSAAV